VKLDLSELHVFGCGAYVFLPEEVRANKLAQRLELMTYIRYETGIKGWHFMQPSGAIFTGAMATFDKTLFPCCPGTKTLARTDLGETPDLDLKKAGLPHLSEVRCDMDEWNRLPCRTGCERNVTRHPGNMYGKTCPPSEIERDLVCDWYWKKIVGPEAPSGSRV